MGLQVSAGQLLFWAAALSATAGSVLGAWALYALGRLGGRPMVLRLPRFLGVTGDRLDRTESWFARRGDGIVLLARLVPGLRSVVSIPAGTLRMPVGRFLLFTAVGSFAWNAALIALGTALAASWETVLTAVLSSASTYALAAIAVSGLLVLRRGRALRVRQ